uniref:flotillin-1 isoform X2 n=1 Tax=Agelaius phoeniceus TaxID=39638 RepID=UPI0023EAED6B|nr:flotillin-1 isoform X2 [Agelaius phoeniceus]
MGNRVFGDVTALMRKWRARGLPGSGRRSRIAIDPDWLRSIPTDPHRFPSIPIGSHRSAALPRRDVLHLRPQRGHGGVGFLPQPPGDGGRGPGVGDPVPAADPAVKIQGQNKEMLAAACQMFLGKSESEIGQIALETLEGHQRAIMAHMTVEEIYKDRQKFSDQVFRVASSDLVNMGISVVSYTLKDVHDEQDYLRSLGKGRTAQVQRDARVGEAEAKRDAGIREARARQEQVSAQLLSEEATARAQRDFQVAQAECDGAVSARRATAELAFQLQAARSQQAIAAQRGEVALVERAQRVQLQEQEVGRRRQELEATVRKPAEAERYRLERLAEAQRTQVLLQAEAEAEALKVTGAARAAAVASRARAEAAAAAAKAEAFGQFQDAAVVDLVLQRLPQVAEAVAQPLLGTRRVTLVGGSGAVGVAKIPSEILDLVTRLPGAVGALARGSQVTPTEPEGGTGATETSQNSPKVSLSATPQ